MAFHDLENKIHQMVDDLQGLCSTVGLSNTANEEVVVTSVFLYKFLNDKFMYNLSKFAKELDMSEGDVLGNEKMLSRFYKLNSSDVAFAYEDTVQYLINHVEQQDFYKQFDEALERISKNAKNDAFAVETADGEKTPLFVPLTTLVEGRQRNNFAKAIFGIIAQEKFDFSEAFDGGFDFYSAIFEYLIKNYNVASGTYAEYFTPQTVSAIIAKILVGMSDKIEAAEIYDPAAGSGSLILHLAHELGQESGMNRAIVYTQDISAKSTRFLRLNMMLNGKSESLGNIIRGDTLESPAHYMVEHEADSGLKKFSYITTNPPFKTDFSATRDRIEQKWQDTDRFFAGVPKIPNKKKESMAIYLMFIQHVLYSLKDDGKAAIVVPTGFITAQSGIEKKLRERMVSEKMLKGVISMPSNIFANTGTNVSVIFLDKANKDDDVILIDASSMGEKVKDGKNQKTVLRDDEVNKIINTFINRTVEDDFSIVVPFADIEEKNCSFSAGQYFDVKIEYVEISQEEYDKMVADFNADFAKYVEETMIFQENIKQQLRGLKVNDGQN
jgi:type I restriction enzyme M protein